MLDEIARGWKRAEGPSGVLVDGGEALKAVLKAVEVGGGGPAEVQRRMLELRVDADTDMEEGDSQVEDVLSGVDLNQVDPNQYLKFVSAFEQTRYLYNPAKKQYERGSKPKLLPPATHKTALFKHHYNILYSRQQRDEQFQAPTFGGQIAKPGSKKSVNMYFKVTPICNLLGRAGQTFLIMGLLTHTAAGRLSVVDPTGSIDLVLEGAKNATELVWYTPGCFVNVNGEFQEDGTFRAYEIGSPPAERRAASAEVFGHVDFLGNGVSLDMAFSSSNAAGKSLRRVEKGLDEVRFSALGDVELDQPRTLKALKRVLQSFQEEGPPLVCFLVGSFTKVPFGTDGDRVAYKGMFMTAWGMDRLANDRQRTLMSWPNFSKHSNMSSNTPPSSSSLPPPIPGSPPQQPAPLPQYPNASSPTSSP